MAHKTTFLAGLIFLLSSLLFAQGELYGPVYIIGDDGRLYIDNIPDTVTASYLAVIDDGWLKKLDIDNLELDTSNIAGLYDYLNAKSDTGHIHDTSDVNNLSFYLDQKLNVSDTSDLARKAHDHTISDVTGLQDVLELKLDVTELDNFYTKTQLQTSGGSSVHWGNVTNAPSFITGVDWNEIGGDQSLVNVSGFNNDAGYLTGNPFDQDLNTTDRVKFDGVINYNAGVDSYHYRNVASTRLSGPNTGTIKITMPQSWSNTMLTIKISGYEHDAGWWECIITGYNYSSWSNRSCELRGNPPFSDVRLAHDGTKCCLLLGNTSTSWRYPNIHITDVITGHNNYSGWSTGWSIDLITDETGITNIATSDVDKPWHSGNLDPSDYYTKTNLQTSEQASVHWGNLTNKPSVFPPASHNHDASNINSGTLSNDRLSFNPDYFVQGTSSYRRANYTSTNTLDDNDASGFFRLHSTDPASPDGIFNYYGFRTRVDASYSVELVGNAAENKLLFGGLAGGTRQPWREIWHSGNLDTANIARRNVDNVFTGVNTFSDTVGIKNGIKISDNSNHFFMIGPDLHGEAGNELPSIKFYLKDYSSGYPNTSEQSIKVEADWIRNYADYRINNTAKRIENSGLSIFSDDHIGGGVVNPVYIRNNYSIDSTGAQITFGFDHSTTSDYHHAGIKAMRTNKGANHASSIYLQARTPGTSAGPSGLTDIVEAGINDHQAFVKYHNNPPVIHGPDSLILVNTSLTFNPHRGSYAAYSGNPPQTMTLGSGEHGQTTEFCIVDGTFPLTIVYEGGYVVTEYGKIYKFKYLEGWGWFKYE